MEIRRLEYLSRLKHALQLEVTFLGVIPSDDDLMAFEFEGKPLVDLGDDSPVYQAVARMMEKILA